MKIEKFEKYLKITAEKDMFLTDYKDGDDIITFSSSIIMIMPVNGDYSDVREITTEENDNLENLQLIELQKREKENEQQQ